MLVRVVCKSGEYSFECSDIVINAKFLTFTNVSFNDLVRYSVKEMNFKIVDVLSYEVQ